ncbi:hypothetical protein M409DRAFT_51907 [Zasmidium cellare ATCC 36951]|uniref:YDG domain-containing protein n=1 Tax=Zasmidium cellare ATCC 36951 TaxID=1080233 RepID=A0A6A6CTW2_ZASCE|nr:uncharacterized protein M409DRAFT_51907 [Zasmidium cellare ATCC 36951]KAF2170153.1 hypothetical protein M409DRAFT_51907 [Zasmidium cellare ATCC 36951]
MGNVQSKEEFDAAQNVAREQGRQEMRKKIEEYQKTREDRQRQLQQTAPEEGEVADEGEVSESSRRDSGANGADIGVKKEKTEEDEDVITVKREPKVNDTSDKQANERAAVKARLIEAEQELAAARKNCSSSADPLSAWNARKQPRQKDAPTQARRDTASLPVPSRKGSVEENVQSPKRTAPDSGFSDDRRPIKKKASISTSSPATPKSPDGPSELRQPPEWYRKLKVTGIRDKQDAEADPLLNGLKNQIRKAQDQRSGLQAVFNEARDRLHKIAFTQVTKQGLRNTRILDNENGLPQIFDGKYDRGVSWPFDIKADAEELYNKWCREDFETDLMRGINCGKPKTGKDKDKNDRSSDSLLEGYPRPDTLKYGNGKLLNGQWWPTQLTCLRDGAHASTQAGIAGGSIDEGEGAYSCIMSGGHEYNDDEDHGEWVLYCGTDSKDGQTTEATKRMINSVGKKPVRLIRSHNLNSPWAPIKGFRYDGLYDVVDKERIDPPGHVRARHRFKLVRREGQDPIRGGDGPERRPTAQEVKAYEKDKHLRGF